MKSKIGLLSLITAVLSFMTLLCCTNAVIHPSYSVISGIVTPESYYSKSTFIDKDTVGSVFENNSLDYWLIGTNQNNKEMSSFRENLRSINKRLKNFHITEMPIAMENDISSSVPMIWTNNGNTSSIPPLFRETDRSILYETFRIKYDGALVSHFDYYIALLDSGYIIAPIPCAEIIGPEWNINNSLRMNLIIRQDSKNQIIDALANRRIFISSGDDINMTFSINDNKIGSIIKSYDGLNIQYRVTNHDAKIKAVEVISNNGEIVFAQHDIDENDKAGKFQLSNINDFAYFYLKSYFENGETAFTAPIWTIRDKKVIINDLSNRPTVAESNNYGSTVTFTAENIANEHLPDITWSIIDSNQNILQNGQITLRKREKKIITTELSFDTPPENITITVTKDDYTFSQTAKLHSKKVGRIIFDASHHNIFHHDFNKVCRYLREDNHIVEIWDDYEQYYDYDNLSQYDVIVITSPNKVYELIDSDMKFFGRLNKFVYNGGKIILAGYNDSSTAMPIIFMNECLRVVYSRMKFYVDSKYNLSAIADDENNFGRDKNMPIFTGLYPLGDHSISQIYLKNPIEFRSGSAVPPTKMYGVRNLIAINNTTSVNGRIPKYTGNYTAAIEHGFGFGKVVLLSGINFSDYDIDNLDNKKWFIALVNNLISGEE
ncbi:MAG: hypothetical protein IKP67_00415 [Spirochaetales bacterium]|nr:hypothetical protein [Spirochaetales bacterium]